MRFGRRLSLVLCHPHFPAILRAASRCAHHAALRLKGFTYIDTIISIIRLLIYELKIL